MSDIRRHVDLTPTEHREIYGRSRLDCECCRAWVRERLDTGVDLIADHPEQPLSAYIGGDGS